MAHLVLAILNSLDDSNPVIAAWESAGVEEITILESTGLGKARRAGLQPDMPMMPSLSDFFQGSEEEHRTIFTVIEEEALVDKLIDVTQQILGDLEDANNGVVFVLPVSRFVGLDGGQTRTAKDRG